MINKRIWAAASMVIMVLILVGCASTDEDKELIVGRWELSNIESIMADEAVDFAEFEEYMQMSLAMNFASDGTFTFEINMMLDMPSMLADLMGSDLEIDAETADINISIDGTYEIASKGELLLNFENDSVTVSPDEYCFTVAGFETCQSVEEFAGGMDEFAFYGDEGAYYEVDATSLTLWDDECDYPDDATCAANFTK